MTKVSKPTGLIRYASEQNIKDKQPFTITRRIMAYSAVLVALVGFLSFQLATRTALETVILRAPGQLFQEQADNKISNLYTAKLFNKTHEPIFPAFRINDKQASIKIVGNKEWVVPKEGMLEIEFFILIPRAEIKDRKTNLTIEIFDKKKDKIIDFAETTFMGVPFK
jgi:polyferredoxin